MLWFEAFRVSPSPVTSETGTGRIMHPFQIDLSKPRDFLSIRGLDNSIWMFNSTENLNFIIFPNLCWPWFFPKGPPSTCQHWSTIFLSERKKKIYVTPPPTVFFLRGKKSTHFPNRDFVHLRAWWCSETRSAKVWSTWEVHDGISPPGGLGC